MKKNQTKHRVEAVQLAQKIGDKAVDVQSTTTKHINRYLARRAGRVQGVRRFIGGWLVLVLGLCVTTAFASWNLHNKSKIDAPTSGGTYKEGIISEVNNLNPLFASSNFDAAADQLIFSSLLKYDTEGKLSTDIARSWEVGKDGKTYIVKLRDDVSWHDGEPFTARDVSYTVRAIQNPQTRSSLLTSWQGVTVKVVNDYEVAFQLSAPFAPFPHALTVGMLPAHILEDEEPKLLRTTQFNNAPIGTGPFKAQVLRNDPNNKQLELVANSQYHGGKPQVDKFVLVAYENEEQLVDDLLNREITSAVDVSGQGLDRLADDRAIANMPLPVRNGVFAFFKTSKSPLSEVKLRQALVLGIDRRSVLDIFDARYKPLKTAILSDHLGYTARFSQNTNIKRAGQILSSEGWKLKDGTRVNKKGQPLELVLATADTQEYHTMATELERQWKELGVTLDIQYLDQEQLKQNALSSHDYDIFLYGISIGADPDVYAYWHSSQARPGGLNFSEWKSDVADLNLELGRTRLDPKLRAARYGSFLQEWERQSPAVALYQPQINYSYHQSASGITAFPLNRISERLSNVQDWTVETRSVHNTP